jgi:AraC-like DNA-binding protein
MTGNMTQSSNSDRPYLVDSQILLGCAEAADELGIDLLPLLRQQRIDAGILQSPEGYLSHHQVINFLAAVAEGFDCEHFGFLVGKHQPPLRIGLVTQILKLSPNLRMALENAIRYQQLYSEMPRHELDIEGGYASFIRWDRIPFQGNLVQLHTLGIVQAFKLLKALGGKHWQPVSVCFAHTAPREQKQYARFFGCPVLFDSQFDGVIFPERELYSPIATADADLLAIVMEHLDYVLADQTSSQKDGVHSVVRNYIQRKIGSNLCNLDSCAEFMGVHPRALQRALAKNNSGFQQLLLETRMELAGRYLQNSEISLSNLAELLGYRNLSAFSRAFKATHGASPLQWRAEHTGAPAGH